MKNGKPKMAKKKNLPLSKMPKLLWELHNKMVLIRRFEESTIKSYQQKKIGGFLHAYIGQEAVGVGVLAHKKPEDSVVTS